MANPAALARALADERRPLRLDGLSVHVGDGGPPRLLSVQIEGGRFAAPTGGVPALDLGGWVLLPGLCDAHIHLFHEARKRVRLDLSAVATRDELFERLAADAGEEPLLAVGWDESGWGDARFPTRAELDRLFPDRPVGLLRVCGHAAVANGAALAALEETGANADSVSGLLLEDAAVALSRRFPPDFDRLVAEARGVADGFAALGLTAVTDMGAHRLPSLAAALPADFPLRVEYFHAGPPGDLPTPASAARVRPLGGKFFLDGSIGGRSAAVAPPYREGGEGELLFADDALRAGLAAVFASGQGAALHAIGERALEQALRVLAELAPGAGRARIEHVEMIGPGQLERAAELGLSVCLQPNFMDRWGRPGGLYERALGPDYRARFSRPAELRAAGLRLAYGTDGMPAALWPALRAAVDPELFGTGVDTPRGALAAVTGDAAAAAGRAGAWGRVAPGLSADFCLVESDPLAENFREEPVVALTALAGRPTWLHPRHQGRST